MCCEYSKLIDHGLDKIFVPIFAIQNSSETAQQIDFEFLGKLFFTSLISKQRLPGQLIIYVIGQIRVGFVYKSVYIRLVYKLIVFLQK